MIVEFSKHLGVAFQILNDLKDWTGDDSNKMLAGADALAMRPTLLLALALESANPTDRAELEHLLNESHVSFGRTTAGSNDSLAVDQATFERNAKLVMNKLAGIYERCQVFEKAQKLIDKSRARVEALADEVQPDSFVRCCTS